MNPEEEITNMLDLLDELLEGIDQIPDADDHVGPAGECSRYGAQRTGSLRSPDCPPRTVSSPRAGSPDTFGASRFARTEPGQQNTRHCAYFRDCAYSVHPSPQTHPTPGSVTKDG